MASTEIKQHIPIFISSTYEDLIPYRDEVQRNLVRLEQIIKGMEYFGSDPRNSFSMLITSPRMQAFYRYFGNALRISGFGKRPVLFTIGI